MIWIICCCYAKNTPIGYIFFLLIEMIAKDMIYIIIIRWPLNYVFVIKNIK